MVAGNDREDSLLIQRLCQRFGCTETMAAIMAHLILEQQPKSIDDLVAAIHLSRTSVSTALSALETRNVVLKEKRGRVGYYISNIDFVKLIADQPVKLLEEEIRPLISILEKGAKSAEDREQARRYGKLVDSLKGSASTLEKIIDCMRANR